MKRHRHSIFNSTRFSIISSAFLLLAFSASDVMAAGKSNKTKVIHFKAAHGPYQVIQQPLNLFKEEVEKLTEGRVKVEISIPQSVVETNQEHVSQTFKAVQTGEIQMSQLYTTYMTSFNKDFYALEVPFIMKDHQHAFQVVDGEIGKTLLASLDKNSPLKGLGFTYCGGYRLIGSVDKKIMKLEDFKGLKIKPDSPMSESALSELGASIINSISKEKVMDSLTNKEVDSYVSVYPRYFHSNEYKTARTLNALDLNTQFTVLVINKKFFNSLTKKDQEVVAFAAQKASAKERQLAVDIAEDVLKNASKYGVEVVRMSAEEKERLVNKLDSVDWAKKHGFSADLIGKIKELAKPKLTYSKAN